MHNQQCILSMLIAKAGVTLTRCPRRSGKKKSIGSEKLRGRDFRIKQKCILSMHIAKAGVTLTRCQRPGGEKKNQSV
jgi:hypothetical protein